MKTWFEVCMADYRENWKLHLIAIFLTAVVFAGKKLKDNNSKNTSEISNKIKDR